MSKKLKHDQLVKRIMASPVAAGEFFEEYLPTDIKNLVNLGTLKVEQESYVEEHLRQKYSDLIYSVLTKENDKAFIVLSIEHQSSVDKWIAFRLLKYNLLLWEKYKNEGDKFPPIYNIVFYNGKEPYTAPLSFWDLFENSSLAKEWMIKNYHLVDLQAMPDNEIAKQNRVGMLSYMLKVRPEKSINVID